MTATRRLFQSVGAEYWLALVLLAGHLFFISRAHVHVNLASSNLMTNLIRLEGLRQMPPDALALAGSSVSGRLSPSYFSSTTEPVVNIGLDGCATMDAAEALLGANREPAILLLEMNGMAPHNHVDFEAVQAALSPVRMTASSVLPFLQAQERPVDLLYSFINSLKSPGSSERPLIWNEAISAPPHVAIPADRDGQIADYLAKTRPTLASLKNRGVRVAFVLIPDSYFRSTRNDVGISISQSLAAEFDLPLFDLRHAGNVESLSWTDGIHLTAVAAKEVVRFLEADVIPRLKARTSA